jgi:hypothetical protein
LLTSGKDYKSAFGSKPVSTAKQEKWSVKIKSSTRNVGSFGFTKGFQEDEDAQIEDKPQESQKSPEESAESKGREIAIESVVPDM